jgi:hypothetical protein
MIENNLLKTNFIGKDGFRWWIGQVAPEAAQGDQLNQIGNTWGCRMKVRIYGYHPADITELKDEDLPWAQVLLSSQGGSGKANRARSIRIAPGDTVMGFFLDGDDAQLPVILGIFANTGPYYASDEEYKSPFQPFTGYTSKIKPNNEFIAKNEGGDDSNKSQKSPRFLTKEIVEDLKEQQEKGKAQLEQLVDSEELQNAASEASAELKQVIDSGAIQTGLKNTAANTKPIIENLKKNFSTVDTQAFKAIGQEIILGSGVQAAAANTKSTNKIKGTLKNTLSEVKNAVPQDKFKGLANGAKQIVSASKPMIKDMVNTTFDELAPQLNGGLNKLYKDKFGEVMGKTGNLAVAKKAAQAAQVAMVGPVMALQNAMPCAVKKITDKLTGDVANLLAEFTNNVDNFTDCIGDQFIGALFNDMIKGINTELADAISGVANIFPSGDIEGLLRNKAEGLLGIASVFDDCDIPTADLGSKTNKWILGAGPGNLNLENIAGKVLAIANAAQELKEAAASPGGVLGNLGFFDFMRPDVSTPGFSSTLSDCYTGPPLNCSGIKVNLFGGGGSGAQVNPILGAIVSDTFAVQTASLIGMKVTNAGSGYQSPPFVEIEDTCRKGYGAVARSVIDYDPSSPTYQQVTDVYVVSSGENYPVIEPEEGDDGVYTVDHVVVVKPGQNYKQEDTVVDDKGNVYEKILDDQGRILNVIPPDPSMNNVLPFSTLPELEVISSTGIGALLKAQLAPRPTYQGEVKIMIDCISPRNTNIVGFINGEPYYGAFHVMSNGVKMTGVKHTGNDMIIYDTPQESRTSRGMMSAMTPITTVSSAPIQNVSDTTTTSQSDTSDVTTAPQMDIPDQTPTQQPSQQTYTPPPSSPPSGGGSSGSGGGSSGGGGYGGGY